MTDKKTMKSSPTLPTTFTKQKVNISRKNYLNGIDWVMNAIHDNSLKYACSGNDFIIVMELKDIPAKDKLDSLLLKFVKKFPLLSGHTSRNLLNLAPYWKYNDDNASDKDILSIINVDNKDNVINNIRKFCNEPMNREYVLFRLFIVERKSFLTAKFDHRLFDGRGGEGFLNLLQREWLGLDIFQKSNNRKNPSHLNRWMNKLSSGKILNRMMIKLLKNGVPINLPKLKTEKKMKYSFRHISFNKAETSKIISNANEKAGLFMTLPYLLANFITSFHAIAKSRGINTNDYIIPVNIDQRQNKEVLKKVFFNNWSMIFFKISQDDIKTPSKLIESIKEQMYNNISGKYSMHLTNANYLMRILPLNLMHKLTNRIMKGTGGSFSFSFLKDSVYEHDTFMNSKVLNIYHIPNMPIQPGIGLFYSSFGGKITAVLSFIDSILSDTEIELIEKDIKSLEFRI